MHAQRFFKSIILRGASKNKCSKIAVSLINSVGTKNLNFVMVVTYRCKCSQRNVSKKF